MKKPDMMKLSFIFILLLLSANVYPSLINGDFEADPVGTINPNITGWTVLGTAGPNSNYIISNVSPHGGSKALKFTKYSGYVATKPANAIVIQTGMDYTFKFWVRCDSGIVNANCRIEIYQDVDIWSNTVLMAKTYFTASSAWQQVTCLIPATALVIGINVDMLIGIRLDAVGTSIYIDDVTLTETGGGPNMSINTTAKNLVPEAVNHRLTDGPAFSVIVDASKILRKVNKKVMGVSFHTLTGTSNKAPFSNLGQYPWFYDTPKTKKIQDLNLPFTRIYNIKQADVWNDINTGLDKAAELSARLNINQENIMLEFDPQDASSYINPTGPDSWQSHVQYSINKGYKFKHWEICNEIYLTGTFPSPANYSAHIKDCATGIKAIQPDGKIGMSVIGDLENNYGWSYFLAENAAGSYDFICPHLYSAPITANMDNAPVEEIALETNFRIFERIQKWNAVLKYFNPTKPVEILDSEWAMTGKDASGNMETTARNTNIVGTLHRAVRLIYYLREGMVGGANQWLLVTKAATNFGFYLIPVMATTSGETQVDQVFVPYFLNYYLGRYLGEEVIDISGTCPYYNNGGYSGPSAAVLVTKSADGNILYIVVTNGTEIKNLPCTIAFNGFNAATAAGKVLNQSNLNSSPLLNSESEVMSNLSVSAGSGNIQFTAPAHSICFITVNENSSSSGKLEISPGNNEVVISPNPFIAGAQPDISFVNLLADSSVDIYLISGQKIMTVTSNSAGVSCWNGKNVSGAYVNSGVYLASVVNRSGTRKTIKFVIEK